MEEKIIFCKGGGCTAKLGAGILERVLERLPEGNKDERLLAGFQGKEDAAIYRISDDEALVQTLDFPADGGRPVYIRADRGGECGQ